MSEHWLCIWSLAEVSQSWCMVGSNFGKWLHKEEKECKKLRKLAPTRQQPFKKEYISVSISENSTHGALLLEKVFCSPWCRTMFADVNKIKVSKCASFTVCLYNWKCEFTHFPYNMNYRKTQIYSASISLKMWVHTLFLQHELQKKMFFSTFLFWLIAGPSRKKIW